MTDKPRHRLNNGEYVITAAEARKAGHAAVKALRDRMVVRSEVDPRRIADEMKRLRDDEDDGGRSS